MDSSQKGFANIALVVVIVILVGAVGYFALRKTGPIGYQTPTPTPSLTKTPIQTPKDETANWKTYTNTQYGFEVKYPAQQWLVKTGSNFVNIYLDRPNSESLTVQITISDQTVANLASKILAEVKSDPLQKLTSDKTINFAGVTSREIIYTPTAGGSVRYVLLNKDGKTFQLLALDTGEENKELEVILSTFKFTK